jgi:hypothetical protein
MSGRFFCHDFNFSDGLAVRFLTERFLHFYTEIHTSYCINGGEMTDSTPEQLAAMREKALEDVEQALADFYEAQGSDQAESVQRTIATMTFLGL